MNVPSHYDPVHGYVPREFAITELSPTSGDRQLPIKTAATQSTSRSSLITVCAAVVLSCTSLYFVSAALLRFSQMLTHRTQTDIAIPESLNQRALSQLQ